jgi:hypothetical protein
MKESYSAAFAWAASRVGPTITSTSAVVFTEPGARPASAAAAWMPRMFSAQYSRVGPPTRISSAFFAAKAVPRAVPDACASTGSRCGPGST